MENVHYANQPGKYAMNAIKVVISCMLLSLTFPAWAVNGFSVSISFTYGFNHLGNGGKVLRYDIQGNAATSSATIFNGLAWYPVISFDGTRVAFFRAKSTTSWDTGFVSVVNKDGTGLNDLVKLKAGQYGYGCNWMDCEGGFLAWPAGEWVYYEKPPKTGEIWRVNVNDPALNHLVVRYSDAGERPGNCACDMNGNEGFWLRRWQLSKDARHCSGMFKVYPQGQQLPHRFPPPEGYAPFSMAIFGNLPACNLCMSPSGRYVSSYLAGCHDAAGIHLYDYTSNILNRNSSEIDIWLNDINSWCGRNTGNLGEYIRWAANSDKWQIQQISNGCGGNASSANQTLINWKDKTALCTTCGSPGGHDGGDFWIDDPANNPNKNKYEGPNGTWVQVTARDIYLIWAVSGTNPYQVSISAYPSDADIRYTTDGSDPTQSSSQYTGTLNLAPTTQVMQVKARAFRTGMNPAETESRILAPSRKALPAGYVKEMLCLENAQNTMIVPMADSAGIWAKYVGENKAIPFDGDQVTVNGHVYTWHLRTDDDGVWSPATAASSLHFFYTTIVSSTSRMVNIGARFHGQPRLFCNGFPACYFDGWDSNHEWIFGSGDYTTLAFLKGTNGLLMQQHAEGVFGVRFLNISNDSTITDLQYFPYAGSSPVIFSRSGRRAHDGISILSLPGAVAVKANSSSIQEIRIINPDGCIVKTLCGGNRSEARIPVSEIGAGVHLVSVRSGNNAVEQRVLVQK